MLKIAILSKTVTTVSPTLGDVRTRGALDGSCMNVFKFTSLVMNLYIFYVRGLSIEKLN